MSIKAISLGIGMVHLKGVGLVPDGGVEMYVGAQARKGISFGHLEAF